VKEEKIMRTKLFHTIMAVALILAFPLGTMAQMASDNYRVSNSVLSSGGTTIDSATYQMTATIGQSSCIGLSSGANCINYAGCWQPTELKIKGKAMPWLHLLLGD
jgi:hypothetical protein